METSSNSCSNGMKIQRDNSLSSCTTEVNLVSKSNASNRESPTYPPNLAKNFFAGNTKIKGDIDLDANWKHGTIDTAWNADPATEPFQAHNIGSKLKQDSGNLVSCSSKRSFETSMVGKVAWLGYSQYHVVAERKRRERLRQRFLQLSRLIPGLKKVDKASIMGDAIKHIKELQRKLKALEDQKTNSNSKAISKNFRVSLDDDDESASDESFDSKTMPEIEARVAGKDVFLNIYHKNHRGMLVKVLMEMESLQLIVTAISSMLFASSSIFITVTAQFEEGNSMTVDDLVKKLTSALSLQI